MAPCVATCARLKNWRSQAKRRLTYADAVRWVCHRCHATNASATAPSIAISRCPLPNAPLTTEITPKSVSNASRTLRRFTRRSRRVQCPACLSLAPRFWESAPGRKEKRLATQRTFSLTHGTTRGWGALVNKWCQAPCIQARPRRLTRWWTESARGLECALPSQPRVTSARPGRLCGVPDTVPTRGRPRFGPPPDPPRF